MRLASTVQRFDSFAALVNVDMASRDSTYLIGVDCGWIVRAEPEMEGLLCDLLWADPSDDPGVTNIESLSDQVSVMGLKGVVRFVCSRSETRAGP